MLFVLISCICLSQHLISCNTSTDRSNRVVIVGVLGLCSRYTTEQTEGNMKSDNPTPVWPPTCWCSRGPMKIRIAQRMNSGRYFYVCPHDLVHSFSFIWCDVFHENHSPSERPYFLNDTNTITMNRDTYASNNTVMSAQKCTTTTHLNPPTDQFDESTNYIPRRSCDNSTISFMDLVHRYNPSTLIFFGLGCFLFLLAIVCITVCAYYVGRMSR
ncbi:hypothetical protein ACS0TY_026340 [Phlomoides rotata]